MARPWWNWTWKHTSAAVTPVTPATSATSTADSVAITSTMWWWQWQWIRFGCSTLVVATDFAFLFFLFFFNLCGCQVDNVLSVISSVFGRTWSYRWTTSQQCCDSFVRWSMIFPSYFLWVFGWIGVTFGRQTIGIFQCCWSTKRQKQCDQSCICSSRREYQTSIIVVVDRVHICTLFQEITDDMILTSRTGMVKGCTACIETVDGYTTGKKLLNSWYAAACRRCKNVFVPSSLRHGVCSIFWLTPKRIF